MSKKLKAAVLTLAATAAIAAGASAAEAKTETIAVRKGTVVTTKVGGKFKAQPFILGYKEGKTVVKSAISSAPKVASVTAKGVVTGLKEGKATVTIVSNHGKCKFKVAVVDTSEKTVVKKMNKLKAKYPHGSRFDNEYPYSRANMYSTRFWYSVDGKYYTDGYGCFAFAAELSDAAYGDLGAKAYKSFKSLAAGDIVCVDGGAHFVMVTKVAPTYVQFAHGNWDRSALWGQKASTAEFRKRFVYGVKRSLNAAKW